MARREHHLTEAEWAIMEAVWEHEPAAAPAIQEVLQDQRGWSYSTVKTFMDRMAGKGLLKTERIRNLILYRAAIHRKDAQRGELTRAVARAFNGAFTPMVQFLLDEHPLSDKELAELEAMIRAKKQKVTAQRSSRVKPRDLL
ncbi:MAG: BlaI/MecI/CopY family transcriptional regulator [Phycisphaerae bacterium]|nr:BlaI/MecI/CopY family transcriptional regulator [Phycisphaerae bacterium]